MAGAANAQETLGTLTAGISPAAHYALRIAGNPGALPSRLLSARAAANYRGAGGGNGRHARPRSVNRLPGSGAGRAEAFSCHLDRRGSCYTGADGGPEDHLETQDGTRSFPGAWVFAAA